MDLSADSLALSHSLEVLIAFNDRRRFKSTVSAQMLAINLAFLAFSAADAQAPVTEPVHRCLMAVSD